MSEDFAYKPLPRAFRWVPVVVFLGAALALWVAPSPWNVAPWAGPAVLSMFGLQWAIWPQSNAAFHPFGVRILGFLCLAIAAFILIQFVSE